MRLTRTLRAFSSLYPLNTPRASLLRWLPAVPQAYGEFPDKGGSRVAGYWSGRDEVSRGLFWFGDFEPWVNRTLQRFATTGSVALDIGANIGATALLLARCVGPSGRVVAFEPMPQNLSRLRQNVEANRYSWVDVVPVALSDRASGVSMVLPADQAGMSCVIADSPDAGAVKVESVPFDDWLGAHPLRDISVCKIDVEGHEASVLAGMRETLRLKRIPAFVFERHAPPVAAGDPVFDLFAGHGYRLFRIGKGVRRAYYSPFTVPPRGKRTADYVAVLPQLESRLYA